MDFTLAALGQEIAARRKDKGLTQDELGTAAGYGAGAGVSISRIERGLTRPRDEFFDGIAAALDLEPSHLEAAAVERTKEIARTSVGAAAGQPPEMKERLDGRSKRLEREVQRRGELIDELTAAFEAAHDRARDRFLLPFVEVADEITGTPEPGQDEDDDDEVPAGIDHAVVVGAFDPVAEAAYRIRFASSGVGRALVRQATDMSNPNVLKGAARLYSGVGEGTAYLAFRTTVALGTSSTGRPVTQLRGIAQMNAALAILGRGTLANGGKGTAGGQRALTGIKYGAPLLLLLGVAGAAVANRHRKLQRELSEQLGEVEADIEATKRGFAAVEDILPRATQAMDDIAVHGGRALDRWQAQLGARPLEWEELDSAQKERYQDFVQVAACQLAVASIDLTELMESRGEQREHLIALADNVLTQSQALVATLV